MRGILLGVLAGVAGCQHVTPMLTPPAGLGGGVVPATYVVRRAEPGTAPVQVPPAVRRTTYIAPPRHWHIPEPITTGHAADYRWVVGQLVQERGAWHVRYGGPNMTDRHGGVLQLLDVGPTVGFHPGQTVRVEGDLVDPAPYEIRPAYRVRMMTVVGR